LLARIGKVNVTNDATGKLRGEIVLTDKGSLANDGKVIDDIRTYE